MKTFQKLALVSAIAAAPFAAQAMEALDDSVLGNTTGQAGVTIEIDIAGSGISVGEIEYTDTAVGADGDGGSVKLQNLVISNVNGLKQTIDVKEGGDLVIGMNALDGVKVALGGTATTSAVLLQANTTSTDAGVIAATAAQQAEVVNNLSLTVDVGKTTQTIYNMSSKAAGIVTYVGAGDALTQEAFDTGRALVADGAGTKAATQDDVDNGVLASAAVASLANTLGSVGVKGSKYIDQTSALAIGVNASFEITDLDVGLFGYTAAQADGGVVAAGIAAYADGYAKAVQADTDAGGGLTVNADAYTAAMAADSNNDGVINEVAAYTESVKNGAAIKINNLKFYGTGGEGTKVTANQTIWAKGGSSVLGGGVYIQMGEIKGTLDIGGIELGGSSIGQVKVSNINLAGMTQRIYGH